LETFLIKAIQFILSLSLLIFIHELGHFFWARLFKVRVEKFYLFFDAYDKALWRWKPKGSDTEYGIGWIPFGGYCKISGMVDESMDKEQLAQAPQPWEYRTQSAGRRALIISGGVINNVLLALVIYVGMMWYWGTDTIKLRPIKEGMEYSTYAQELGFHNGDILWAVDGHEVDYASMRSALLLANNATVNRHGELIDITLPDSIGTHFLRANEELDLFAFFRRPMVVGATIEGGNAAQAGLLPGDSIIAAQGVPTRYADEVKHYLSQCSGDTVQLTYIRGNETLTTPVAVNDSGMIGIAMKPFALAPEMLTHVDYSLLQAIPAGLKRCGDVLYNYVRQFKLVFTKEGAKSVGGFATMGSIFPTSWDWMAFWSLSAFFSIALAFMNILPIPALDGGHLFFLIYEVITRRKPSDKVLERAQYVGFFIVLALLVFANANDIYRFIIKPLIE
jgi:regulator of sigma E protease